jgi:hypothetical protein
MTVSPPATAPPDALGRRRRALRLGGAAAEGGGVAGAHPGLLQHALRRHLPVGFTL